MQYTRFEAIFGHVELPDGQVYPIIVCEVLAENMETAEHALDMMGFTEAIVRPTNRDYHHLEYNMN